MEKYMVIHNDCPLYKDYFAWKNDEPKVVELFKKIKELYGIESNEVYISRNFFKIVPTQNDMEKFSSMMKKTSYGEFKKNSEASKYWMNGIKSIENIEKPRLYYYFDLLGNKWSEMIFDVEGKLYCSIKSDGDVITPYFSTEIKASEFYKIIEESEEN